MRYRLGAAVAGLASLMAADALSCTIIQLDPEGRRYYQRGAWDDADSVFLARATPNPLCARTEMEPIATIEGDRPPSRSHVPIDSPGDCGWLPPPRGVVIAFARRVRPGDAPWRPWLWGRWTVFSHLNPSEVTDEKLASALRDTARRPRQK